MKSEMLPDLDGEDLDVKTLFPDPEYFQGWDAAKKNKIDEINDKISEDADIVALTHTDADGYGCEIMLRKAFKSQNIQVISASESGPHSVKEIGDYLMKKVPNNAEIFIMDLAPDNDNGRKFIDPFRNHQSKVTIVDHHKWSDGDYDQINWVADVYHNTDKCATQIVHDEFIDNPDKSITELADLTADHDLWIKEDEKRSDALSDLAYGMERENYVKLGLKHGVDMINTNKGENIIENERQTRNKKTEIALNRAKFYNINGYSVAVTYGECNASDVGSQLYDQGEVDLACVIYPNGNVSLRSSDDTPVSRKVAVELGGNGHKCAAGCSINMIGESVNYTTHWATMGKAAREKLVEVIRETL